MDKTLTTHLLDFQILIQRLSLAIGFRNSNPGRAIFLSSSTSTTSWSSPNQRNRKHDQRWFDWHKNKSEGRMKVRILSMQTWHFSNKISKLKIFFIEKSVEKNIKQICESKEFSFAKKSRKKLLQNAKKSAQTHFRDGATQNFVGTNLFFPQKIIFLKLSNFYEMVVSRCKQNKAKKRFSKTFCSLYVRILSRSRVCPN